MTVQNVIPVIDLFAGPGGLCEGFSSVKDAEGNPRFAVKVSIEKDPVAHRTLHLRAMFRKFPKGGVPDIYYQYIRGEVKREEFLVHPDIKEVAEEANHEARCAELGRQKNWVLSTHGGRSIFDRIMGDLREPKAGLRCEVRSLVVDSDELEPRDHVIQSENYGIPQCRHRVILFCIRSDVVVKTPELTAKPRMFLLNKTFPKVDVETALSGRPAIRSRLFARGHLTPCVISSIRSAYSGSKVDQ